jgi:hypothetical protein
MKRQSILVLASLFFLLVVVAFLQSCSPDAKAPQVLPEPVYLHQIRIGMTGEEMDELGVPGELIAKNANSCTFRCGLMADGMWKSYL